MKKLTEDQFIAAYQSSIENLYSFVHHKTKGNRQLTQDIIQETYLRALQAWRQKGLPQSPDAWLIKVARNLFVSHLRKTGPEILTGNSTEGTTQPVDLTKIEQIQFTRRALSKIRKGYARLIEAFHFQGRKISEIARSEGISERAVEGRLRRARMAIRDLIESYGTTEKLDHDR
jgi:RNA polymerase sigma-70 factor (ECF subfamily)